jgi:hypothetical protein
VTLEQWADIWLEAKESERKSVERRRDAEDAMRRLARLADDLDGTENLVAAGYRIKVTGRIDRKVDSEKVQEIAAEHGLVDHLSSLFRWKPELNVSAWKSTDPSITAPLAAAITAKPGRPSFSIELTKE